MVKTKTVDRIAAIAMVCAVVVVSVMYILGKMATVHGTVKSTPDYAEKIFGADVISIEIIADAEDWQQMLDNAMAEEFIMADVVVNGTKFQNVGVRPKGNSSLSQVAQSDSDRYSFRLQFDQYIKGQTCFGLESFVVNNMLGDNSYMKEYISYDLMREIGVEAPYFGFADIQVNGKDQGLYLAVELYNDSYEQRVFGDTAGMLYNVKSMEMKGDNGNLTKAGNNQAAPQNRGGQAPQFGVNNQAPSQESISSSAPDAVGSATIKDGATDSSGKPPQGSMMPNGALAQGDPSSQTPDEGAAPTTLGDNQQGGIPRQGNGMGGRGNTGGSLAYTDDNSSSYSAIFGNAVGKSKESDYQRVITALKALSEGRELEEYFDVDQILRYLAAHTIVVNLDSYSSSMAQNYYLYEREGQVTILPWDYNFAWGAFQSRDASPVINFPINTPVSGIEMSSRPLLDKLFANQGYLENYHAYLQELIDGYFTDGKFEAKVQQLSDLISPYVEKDPTAFCSYTQYQTAVEGLIQLGNLRAQSVQGQLDGTVPSTTAEQAANPDKLISAGDLNLSSLGNMGGGRGNQQGDKSPQQANAAGQQGQAPSQIGGEGIVPGNPPEGIPNAGRGGMPRDRQGMNPQRTPPNDQSSDLVGSKESLYITGAAVCCLLMAILVTARLRRTY